MYNEGYGPDSKNKQQATWQFVRNYTGNVCKSVSILNEIPKDQKSCEVRLDGDNGAKFKYESLNNSLVLENTDPQEVYNIIKSLKNTRSTGFDEIPITLIKEVAD
ncbi:hypothetical protein HHI36_022911 [Cryptolaemus montrouzieri]|uniref:Reverse transcriptase n=1 Tax=Cryptolaemus montrouzieri TaxID=559131 RepID=A0ABD2PG90_9CUCU